MTMISLDSVEWEEFNIKDIFDIFTGYLINNNIIKDGFDPRITATNNNNGIAIFTNKLSSNARYFSNFISISFLGSVFYQEYKASLDMKIHGIKPKNIKLNKYIALFLIPCIKKFTFNYNYGYQLSTSILKTQKLKLPIDTQGNPNWRFMEEYIKQKQKEKVQKIIDYYKKRLIYSSTINKKLSLNDIEWKQFDFDYIFKKIQRGKRIIKSNQIKGFSLYISSTSLNNGLDDFIDNKENVRKFEKCLTLANSGSVGSVFYHQYEFIASDHITSLKIDNANKYIYLFIATIIKRLEKNILLIEK